MKDSSPFEFRGVARAVIMLVNGHAAFWHAHVKHCYLFVVDDIPNGYKLKPSFWPQGDSGP